MIGANEFIQSFFPDELLVLVNKQRELVAGALLAALLIGLWVTGRLRKRRRTRVMLAALQGSTRGRVVPFRGPSAWGFTTTVTPAPEPFREFSVSYRPLSIFDPIDLAQRLGGRTPGLLHVWALLPESPSAEIVWIRGQAPGRAVGREPGRGLWIHHRLDIRATEYATRGPNTAALCHVFLDMQARFGPLLQRVIIQREGAPQVEVVLTTTGLDTRDIPALLTTLRAAGRAALLR